MMRSATIALAAASLLATAAFAQSGGAQVPTPAPASAPQPDQPATPTAKPANDEAAPVSVELKGADGSSRGSSKLTATPGGVILMNDFSGLEDGPHAIHIHETGVCEGDFSSAGGHYNPDGKEHGYTMEGGPHAGDMPNFTAMGGAASFDHMNPMVSLTGGDAPLDDADGSALVVHAKADDYASQPSGEAGDRVACGVIFPKK